nr:cobalamin-dependent protein [uncultured Desulfobacter sp.]
MPQKMQKPEIIEETKKRIFSTIMEGDRDLAVTIVRDWAIGNSYEDAIHQILEPVMETIGKDWGDSEKVSLGQGYVLSKVVEDIFKEAARKRLQTGQPPQEKGPVVIGNILDDNHSLGRKLVKIFLETEGWKVYDLGNDVPAVNFVDKALETDAPVIAVSAMMLRTALNIKEVRAEIDRRKLGKKIKLAVGGAVFCQRPELVNEVGGDGTSYNAIGVCELMEKLVHDLKSVQERAS